jgi:uncharacterized OB-fold protein
VPGTPLPAARFENEAFWTAGEHGQLLIHRCTDCGLWLHPPKPVCRRCHSLSVAPQQVSGFGTVHTFTVNHQAWLPDLPVPYVIAIIELDEDSGLRVSTRLVDVAPEDVHIGLRVKVVFQQEEDIWLPLFTPSGEASKS